MPFPLVKPGEKFKPSASLSNAVRRHLNESNGFQSGSIKLKNAQIIRVPIYNTTESAFFAGQAVSIDLNGNLKGDCYPAVAYSDEKPCYGVALTDISAGGIGDCALSGLAQVYISGQTTDGNYVTPTQGGEFARSTSGIPIVNVSGGTNAVVMLGNIKSEGGGSSAVIGFPDFSTAYVGWHGDDFTRFNQDHTAPFDCWINASVSCGVESAGGDGIITLLVKVGQTTRKYPLAYVYDYTSNPFIPMFDANSILIPLKSGTKFNLSVTYNGNFSTYIPTGVELYACL